MRHRPGLRFADELRGVVIDESRFGGGVLPQATDTDLLPDPLVDQGQFFRMQRIP
jgi:hypothetical protein